MDLTSTLHPDPGQVFESDEHRRVLAALPDNEHHEFGSLEEMAAHAREYETLGPRQSIPTSRSWAKLVRFIRKHDPNLDHVNEAAISEIVKDLTRDGYVASIGDNIQMTKDGYDALNGPNGHEPPPLEGLRLKAAKLQDQALEEETKKLLESEEDNPPRDYSEDKA